MIVLLAVAVRTPGRLSLEPVPVASVDAARFYEHLAHAAGDAFDSSRSVCVLDPTAAEAAGIIKRTSAQLAPGDCFVLYFSGHADISDGRLFIPFSDAQTDARGQTTIRELQEWLVRCPAERVVILDTCRSGAGLALANNEDVYDAAMTSVLASTGPMGRSLFTADGSKFTNALCASLNQLHSERAPLSLCRLAELIRQFGEGDIQCTVNVREGRSDAILPTSHGPVQLPPSFAHDFLTTVSESPVIERQYLWFDLAKVPLRNRLAVLEGFSSSDDFTEPSWLVRRAIGTALNSCNTAGEDWRRLCLRLLDSPDWMKQCVGLLGARELIREAPLHQKTRELLTSCEMVDAVWLAHLYLADAGVNALPEILRSRLRCTSWGLIDILVRWSAQRGVEPLLEEVISAAASEEDRTAIATHCRLAGIKADVLQAIPLDDAAVALPLAGALYSGRRRGRTVSAELKPLVSSV